MLLIFFTHFQHCSFHLSLHCNWPLCFIILCMCCEIYAVWCVCLIWHNGAYVRSLSRGATCHEGPLFLWTSGGRPWQVLLYQPGSNIWSYIANTSRIHTRTRAYMHTARTRMCTHARTHSRTGYRYSVSPSRDVPLCLRQCRSLAIQITTRTGDPITPIFWMFFRV